MNNVFLDNYQRKKKKRQYLHTVHAKGKNIKKEASSLQSEAYIQLSMYSIYVVFSAKKFQGEYTHAI